MTSAAINSTELRDVFRQWHEQQEPFEAELAESLAALQAFQSNLEAWQQRLAQEREQLAAQQSQLESQRKRESAAQAGLEKLKAGLDAAKQEIHGLKQELQQSESIRAASQAELEEARQREATLTATLDEMRAARETEHFQWADEMRQLRSQLEQAVAAMPTGSCSALQQATSPAGGSTGRGENNSAVLGSIVEQFGKLRQQRAMERPAVIKTR